MLNKWTYLSSLVTYSFPNSSRLCFDCRTCARRSSILLRCGQRQSFSDSTTRYRFPHNDARLNRLMRKKREEARNARESGEAALGADNDIAHWSPFDVAPQNRSRNMVSNSLPQESIVQLPPLMGQRQAPLEGQGRFSPRLIASHDMEATLRNHQAAKDFKNGFIRMNVSDDVDVRRLEMGQDPETPQYGRVIIRKYETKKEAEGQKLEGQLTYSETEAFIPEPTPWQYKLKSLEQNCDASSRLDSEIQAFNAEMTVSLGEQKAVRLLFMRLRGKLIKKFPDYRMEIFGSRATGLAQPLSDIDIRLYIPKLQKNYDDRGPSLGRPEVKAKHLRALKEVRRWLLDYFRDVYSIGDIREHARYPLLELSELKQSQIPIQLVATARPTKRAIEFTKYYQTEYPQIKPLYAVLKWWTRQIGYDNGAESGVSSYLLFNLILTSITHSRELYDKKELGRQLIHFFEFWSTADVSKLGYAPDPARTFPKHATNITEDTITSIEHDKPKDGPSSSAPFLTDDTTTMDEDENITAVDETTTSAVPESTSDISLRITRGAHGDPYLTGLMKLASRAQKHQGVKRPKLVLQDVADPENNAAASANKFVEFQEEMKKALLRLRQSLAAWDRKQGPLWPERWAGNAADNFPKDRHYLLRTVLEAGDKARDNDSTLRMRRLQSKRFLISASLRSMMEQKLGRHMERINQEEEEIRMVEDVINRRKQILEHTKRNSVMRANRRPVRGAPPLIQFPPPPPVDTTTDPMGKGPTPPISITSAKKEGLRL